MGDRSFARWVAIGWIWALTIFSFSTRSSLAAAEVPAPVRQFVHTYCVDCHQQAEPAGDLAIDILLDDPLAQTAAPWERVVRKLTARQMPPADAARPTSAEYDQILALLIPQLDQYARERPNPGRTDSFRRLNRTEYQNAIRDLLDLQVDVTELLPSDELSHGFDNITVTELSPALMDRYLTAAQRISRLAVGQRVEQAAEKTYRVRPDVTQDTHLPGTPLGTRGGLAVRHHFPQTGDYEIQAWLMRDRNEELEGLREPCQLEMLLDRKAIHSFTIAPPERGQSDTFVDANLTARVHVLAGARDLAVVFARKSESLLESVRQPLHVHFNYYRHPRIEPALYQVTIRGPFEGQVELDTASRRRIFVCRPQTADEELPCATAILSHLMQRAYRRPVDEHDLETILRLYREAREQHGFEAGIEHALGGILVSPHFLFHLEQDPDDLPPGSVYRLSPISLASRLAFFLWSSIPDEPLLQAAIDGQLDQPEVLEHQVRRMLADPRAAALAHNFGGQWLYLRNLESATPDMRLFPDFDDNLRQAMRRETELFLESILREDRSVLDLIRAQDTFLNERLAKHYGIPHVYGSRFRRVPLDAGSHRGGVLRHASILTVTSYATRTSPVLRGNWVLTNLLGSPPPPPPPDVPTLDGNPLEESLTVRERLEQHRAHAACASCHQVIDPVGFALENYDAVGRWRDREQGKPVDASGQLLDGQQLVGVNGLEDHLRQQSRLVAQTIAEKLLTYALGRGLRAEDAPAVRQIVRSAEPDNYRFASLVLAIVQSEPFRLRAVE